MNKSKSAHACLIWNVNVLVSMTGCDPDLFEYVLKLRKRRIDLEELLAEKKRSSDALKRKCDFLTEKVVPFGFLSYYINRHVSFTHYPFFLTFWCACFCLLCLGLHQEKLSKSSLRAAEDDLELLYKEDQQKMNSLDVMIPLHLNQVKSLTPNTSQIHAVSYMLA